MIENESLYPERGRTQLREVFPADYLYSFNRVDDLSRIVADEIEFFAGADRAEVQARIDAILALDGDAEAGGALFSGPCAGCHGPDGHGMAFAPDLRERVPGAGDAALVQTLLQGRGAMPAWAERFTDAELADLLAFLRARFGG